MRYSRSSLNTYHSNNINNVYSAGKVSVYSTNTVGGAIGFYNIGRYSTSTANTRANIYYDITVIANYDQPSGYNKPSSLSSVLYGLDSGELFTKMNGRFGAGWYLKEKDETYAYYPQLEIFSNHELKEETNKIIKDINRN